MDEKLYRRHVQEARTIKNRPVRAVLHYAILCGDQAANSSVSFSLNIFARFRKQIMPFSEAMMPSQKARSNDAVTSGTGCTWPDEIVRMSDTRSTSMPMTML